MPKDNPIAGLPLDVERTWTFSATTSAATYNHITAVVTYKTLIITGAGVEVM